MKNRPKQLENLQERIKECIKRKKYTQTKHALQRQTERNVELQDVLYVLKNGWHEKQKTSYDDENDTWKYSIRGNAIDDTDVRVIIAFNDEEMFIITVVKIL